MIVEDFIDAIRFFGEPDIKQGVEKSIILAPYVHELAKYEGETLAAALKLIMIRREYRNFPLLSECLAFCAEAEKGKNGKLVPMEAVISSGNRKTAQTLVLENRYLARQAADEGWLHALWDFCRVNQRRPDADEIDACREEGSAQKRARLKAPNPDADRREERLIALLGRKAA